MNTLLDNFIYLITNTLFASLVMEQYAFVKKIDSTWYLKYFNTILSCDNISAADKFFKRHETKQKGNRNTNEV